MVNVRCPMCSRMNEADAEACAFCGARLKPLRPSSGSSSDQTQGGSHEEDEPEWLRGLRADDRSSGNAASDESSEPGRPDVPDWLSRIRDKAREETQPAEDLAGEGDEGLPDWMNDLTAGGTAESNDAAESADAVGGTGDWLGRLEQDQPPAEDAGGLAEPVSGTDEDWISKLTAWQTEPAEEMTPPEKDSDLDWLSGLEPEAGLPLEKPVTEGDQGLSGLGLTGFLSQLENGESQWTDSEQPESLAEEPELPVWSSQGTDEGLPDWLSGFGQAADTPVEEPAAPADLAGQEGLPDWLSSLESDVPFQADFPSTPIDVPEEEQAPARQPGWLGADSAGADSAEFSSRSGPAYTGGEDELPDWLASFTEPDQPYEITTEPASGEGEEAVMASSELPEWLNEAGETTVESRLEAQDASMRTVENDPQEALPLEPAGALSFMDEDTPDWLRDFSAHSAEDEGGLPQGAEEEGQLQFARMETDQPFEAGDLPEWLAEDGGDLLPAGEELPGSLGRAVEQPAGGEDLVQADLPEWVREMRPIESVSLGASIPSDVDQRVEKAGPLAGLRGILPAEDMVARYHKPPVYSARLRISEKQRGQASLLDSILEQETQPLLIPPQRANVPSLIGRVLVALFLITMLLIPFMIPLGLEPAPMRTPPELEDMFQQIDQAAQSGRPVLLAVDYEPGLAGEMYMTALPVVEHLMAMDSPIVILSTVPSGPVLAQSLLDGAVESLAGHEPPAAYDMSARTANLGYLPGGTISLLEFAQYPRQAAPASVAGDYEIWNRAVLQPVTNLRDFAQVVVITDSAEIGRAWVEQVQPLMGDVPLFMVASAQAEPMLMPFVDSGQIDGLTGGLLGGILYSQWRQVDSEASAYWPSYQIGIGLAFLLVLAGGLVSAGTAFFRRSDKNET